MKILTYSEEGNRSDRKNIEGPTVLIWSINVALTDLQHAILALNILVVNRAMILHFCPF